jgi:hypothetical protein
MQVKEPLLQFDVLLSALWGIFTIDGSSQRDLGERLFVLDRVHVPKDIN